MAQSKQTIAQTLFQVSAGVLGVGTLYWTVYSGSSPTEQQKGAKAITEESCTSSLQAEALERELEVTSAKVWGNQEASSQKRA